VTRLSRLGERFVVVSNAGRFEADHVVVAMSNYQQPRVPPFARELGAGIRQLHSFDYRSPAQLQPGGVLVVGAGNSGAEIALEAARTHQTWLAGPSTGHIPYRIEGLAARLLLTRVLLRGVFPRVLTIGNALGRRVRPKMMHGGAPLIRTRPKALKAAGVTRVARVASVRNGQPVLDDGRVVDVTNVVWCTGFTPGFSWIDLPVFDADGEVRHVGGVVEDQPGLFFVGLHFLYAFSSEMIHGVGRDADRIAALVAERIGSRAAAERAPAA
jgi:putative flavoprotein involved in K+ transport